MSNQDRGSPDSSGGGQPDLADIDRRLKDLGHGAEEQSSATSAQSGGAGSGVGLGMRISVELVVTTAVGTGLGWLLDDVLGTRPLMLVIGLLLGGAAGVMNVYRVAQGLDDGVGLGRAMEHKRQDTPGRSGAGQAQAKEEGPNGG
ncbi:AtpZ/AtpI family protein [Roseospirillum parvum]|uniref:ATP synthase protein I n=1 Tax=Roseospirillum parvum TaxID=83401 RepID=A0A1G7UFU0_9PROT|nr:AtpZ/AtpI family protein [Roseospirillum parvum]SDG46141.1 ATP synthase protein I [Roseospirillum parvum]